MSEKIRPKSAIVVGAGVGGVATAARLAKAGFNVTVLEKNDFTGGRCSLIHHKGYRFDQGPSLLLLPKLFEEAFNDLGTSLKSEGVDLVKCEPNYNIWFGDGESFELSTDVARMKREVEKWEGKDGFERYLAFLQEAHRHYEISVKEVLKKNFTSILSMTRPSFLRHLLALHPFESIYSRASKYFWTERLRRVFTFGSMYMGMSPFDAPGTYSLLQYTELAEGIWYPKGGFHKIIEALVNIGERYGVEYRLSTPVSSIKLSSGNKRAEGVTLSTGETLTADVVIINADLVYAYNNLLPPSSGAKSLEKRSSSCSSISFYWAMDRIIPELTAHNIFLADDYRESFDDIFKKQLIPQQPSFYVNVPTRVDPSAAPKEKDAIVVLCPVGHLLDSGADRGLNPQNKQDWEAMVKKARDAVFNAVEKRTGASISDNITKEIVNTPQSWKETLNLDKGAILGLSHSFFNVLCFRPSTRHPNIQSLHFVGASTHPGTGVPICLAGSKVTSEQVLEGFGIEAPWSDRQKTHDKHTKEIDREHALPMLSNIHIALLVLLAMVITWMCKLGFLDGIALCNLRYTGRSYRSIPSQ
ncbi:MAG: ATP-binding cassette transporter CGR1 [Pycnora praestabilis]|nr:MAG: ATP-binding cassette transporter CGR1 [Pycnora praestabilis]